MLAPTTIFNTTISFFTNTNLQHYSGEVHLSYFSQIFFVCWKQFLSPVIGLCALLAIIRGLRGDRHMGNFYLDMWRGSSTSSCRSTSSWPWPWWRAACR